MNFVTLCSRYLTTDHMTWWPTEEPDRSSLSMSGTTTPTRSRRTSSIRSTQSVFRQPPWRSSSLSNKNLPISSLSIVVAEPEQGAPLKSASESVASYGRNEESDTSSGYWFHCITLVYCWLDPKARVPWYLLIPWYLTRNSQRHRRCLHTPLEKLSSIRRAKHLRCLFHRLRRSLHLVRLLQTCLYLLSSHRPRLLMLVIRKVLQQKPLLSC